MLEKLKALLEAATPGPWSTDEGCYVSTPTEGVWFTVPYNGSERLGVDADLIVEMRNCLPELLAVVEHSKALVDTWRKLENHTGTMIEISLNGKHYNLRLVDELSSALEALERKAAEL